MRGIVICRAGVRALERLVTADEGGILGFMGEVYNSYSELVVEVEVGEGEEWRYVVVDEGREVVFMATGEIGGVCLIVGGAEGSGVDWMPAPVELS